MCRNSQQYTTIKLRENLVNLRLPFDVNVMLNLSKLRGFQGELTSRNQSDTRKV